MEVWMLLANQQPSKTGSGNEKKSIIPLRKGTRHFFYNCSETNFMLSQTQEKNKSRDQFLKNVPCHIGVETKIWYQNNLHSEKIHQGDCRVVIPHTKSFLTQSLTINWLREGVDHWRNLRRAEFSNERYFVRENQSHKKFMYKFESRLYKLSWNGYGFPQCTLKDLSADQSQHIKSIFIFESNGLKNHACGNKIRRKW